MEEQYNKLNIISGIIKTTKLLWKASSWRFIGVFFANAISGLLTPINLYCSQKFVDSIVLSLEGEKTIAYALFWLVNTLLLLVGNIISAFMQIRRAILSEKIELYITNEVIEKCNALSLTIYEDGETINKIKMSLQEAPNRCSMLIDITSDMAKAFISIIGTAGIILRFNGLLLGFIFICMFPVLWVRSKSSKRLYRLNADQVPNHRMKDVLIGIILNVRNAAEFKIFNSITFIKTKICNVMRQQYVVNQEMRRQGTIVNIDSICIYILCAIAVKIWALSEALSKSFSIGKITQLLGAIDALQGQIQSIFFHISMFYEQLLYVNTLYGLLDMPCEIRQNETGVSKSIREIELKNVSFKYKNSTFFVLRDINLRFCAGKTYAIIGENGSGKSTLVKLIMGLYPPCEGQIYFNGKSIEKQDVRSLRRQFSAVFQDYIRYPFSVMDNISIGCDKSSELYKIKRAAEDSYANEFIEALPDGYETQLCKEWKGGVELSGGQWQRIAIARCLFRNSSVQILDEACSSIDNIISKKIQNNLLQKRKKRITIITSHDKNEIKNSDWIIIMKKGKVVMRGKYEEVKTNDLFVKIFNDPQAIKGE